MFGQASGSPVKTRLDEMRKLLKGEFEEAVRPHEHLHEPSSLLHFAFHGFVGRAEPR